MSPNNLRQYRKRAGISQLELSARTRIAPGFISGIETGKQYCWPGWRKRLADALKVEPADLFPEDQKEDGQ